MKLICQNSASGEAQSELNNVRRKRLMTGAAGVGLTLGAGVLAMGAAAAFAYISTHPLRRRIQSTADETGEERLIVEEVTFPSRDGLRLSGWFVPSPGARAGIILCHGFPNNRSEMTSYANLLAPEGYHLLLFDFRALGHSEGDLCSIGAHEVQDLLGAVDYLSERPEMNGLKLGAFGLSMGGAVALMAAAQDERIAAVATHGAYSSLDRAIAMHCRLYFGPFGRAMTRPAIWWGNRWLPLDPREVSPAAVVQHIAPRPVLLFHGARDFIVSPADGEALYEAAKEPKQLYRLPRSWHAVIDEDEIEDYRKTLLQFYAEHL